MASPCGCEYESEGVSSTTTDSANWSDCSEGDLDETVHIGYKYKGEKNGPNRSTPLGHWSGNKGMRRFPDPSYTVNLPASTKFLGMNLDMNRVYGFKVINVKGAAKSAGVEVGDLLVEVNGHTIKGFCNLRELFFTEKNCDDPENTFNVFRFVKLNIVKRLGKKRLRKVFPVERQEHLEALMHDLEVSEHRKQNAGNITAYEDDDYDTESDRFTSENTDHDDYLAGESKYSNDDVRFPPVVRGVGDFRGDVDLSVDRVDRTFYNIH